MTIQELKSYVINEAKKLIHKEVLKEEKRNIESQLSEIDKKAMNAAKRDIEYDGHKFEPLGKNKFEKNINKKELKKAMNPELSESEDSEVNTFHFKLKNDKGTRRITTTGSSEEVARKKVASAEGAPEHAIKLAKAKK